MNLHAPARCIALVLLSITTAAFASSSFYTVSALTGPAGFSNVSMTGINNNGQVGGYGNNGTTDQAFVSTTSGSNVVPLISGWTNIVENGINASGQVGGYGFNGTNDFAFIGSTSGSTAIAVGAGWVSTTGNGINDSGRVTGFAQTGASTNSAFSATTASNSITVIPGIAGWTNMGGLGINATGKVVGQALVGGDVRTFLYNGSTSSPVPILSGTINELGEAINAAGDVAGYDYNGTTDTAFFYNGSTLTAIPFVPGATSAFILGQSLNDSSMLVGGSDAGGWIWTAANGTALLNNLVPAGWSIGAAISISNNGLILAQASFQGGPVEYVELMPTPEPATFLIVGAVLLLFLLGVGRKRIQA